VLTTSRQVSPRVDRPGFPDWAKAALAQGLGVLRCARVMSLPGVLTFEATLLRGFARVRLTDELGVGPTMSLSSQVYSSALCVVLTVKEVIGEETLISLR
jgi:hypothetical protein